jgi:tetratricopeptide (TPR) repeat protein
MASKNNPGKAPGKRQLDAVLVQLGNQRPSDVWRGMDQVRQWLSDDSENRDVYGMLLDAVKESPDLREQVRNLLSEMEQKGSKSAREAMSKLPSGVQDFSADANDAYYAGEYERAIQLYRQVLKLDPDNAHAKDHIAKAEIKRRTGETASGLPRAAEQYYRRARSYIAAREVVTAMNLLSAAIEAARAKEMKYPEAEEALNNMNNLLLADDFKQKARQAVRIEQWKDAVELYSKALALDPTDEIVKKEAESLQNLLEAATLIQSGRSSKLFAPLGKWQSTVDAARLFINPKSRLVRSVEKQINQVRLLRFFSGVLLIIGIIALSYWGIPKFFAPEPLSTITPAATTSVPTQTSAAPAATATQPMEITTSPSITETPTITPTDTPSPTNTQLNLGTGYINKASASAWGVPNSGLIDQLGFKQTLTLLERREVGGSTWYRCTWEKDGVTREGWILGEYITFGPPPP